MSVEGPAVIINLNLPTPMLSTNPKKSIANLNKAARYEILARNQKFLPTVTCRLCTNDWLEDVWTEKVEVPNTIDVRALNCKYDDSDNAGPTPPPAHYIMDALQDAINKKGIKLDVITRRPDNKWALAVLSTLVSVSANVAIRILFSDSNVI